ncbi:hypothetical protein ACNJX9_09355 [Bradyrhizobium sp. DASA03076]|uniref:hypothetical protein n=1 Tax=Bradyrhizobium sp. BLXBL-03 TaxID=3395916 RepID=UPI003F70C798
MEAEAALLLVRKAFVNVIYHRWERGARRWGPQARKKPNHADLVGALTEALIVIDKTGLEELRLLVHCLKHNSEDARRLYVLRRGHLHKVKYGGTRLVDASKILAMLDGNKDARRQVDEVVLLRKAASWLYEQERRLIGPGGVLHSLLELEEVIFGMRCKQAVKYAIVTDGRQRPVRFYEMRELHGTFNLRNICWKTEK